MMRPARAVQRQRKREQRERERGDGRWLSVGVNDARHRGFNERALCPTCDPSRIAGAIREPAKRVAFLPVRISMD